MLKIPYLYPNSPDWISPELTSHEPEQVAEYNNLREELGELTERIFGELVTVSLADYEPTNTLLVSTFAVEVSHATSEKIPAKVLPVPRPNRTPQIDLQKSAKTTANSPVILQSEPGQESEEIAELSAIENVRRVIVEGEEEETSSNQAVFLRTLANIYGEGAVYGKKTKSK